MNNLLADLPAALEEEQVTTLLRAPAMRIERIVSTGQASPPGYWYDQAEGEWVTLLQGEAGLVIEGQAPRHLVAGSFVHLPAHCRHRVEWTSTSPQAVWLAVHYAP